MFRTNIQDTDSMLFDLRIPQRASFWMKNCPESISAAYISPDGVIQEIHHLEKNDTNAVCGRDGQHPVCAGDQRWLVRAAQCEHRHGRPHGKRFAGGHVFAEMILPDRPASSQVHAFSGSGRFVDGHHDFYVAQTFFAGHFGRLIVQDTLGEVVHFRRKLINRRTRLIGWPSLRRPWMPP